MQKIADRILDAAAAKFERHRKQMIVVNPDDVVGLNQRRENVREFRIHRHITRVIARFELRKIETIVEDRP